MKLWLDFETFCELDLKKVGLYRYIYHPSFHVWCCAWAVGNGQVHLVKGINNVPVGVNDPNVQIYAHNAEFEYNVLKRIGYKIPIKRFTDTMALAGRYGYPLQLDKFAKAIGLPYGKTANSTRLINKLCQPKKPTIKDPSNKWTPDTAPQDFKDLYTYCKNDVDIMRKAVNMLSSQELTPYEQLVWGHTIMQNERGLGIDIRSVKNIQAHLQSFDLELTTEYGKITGLNSVKQYVALKEWFHSYGVKIPNVGADTVTEWLDKSIPDECRRVLQLKQMLGHSSTAKFDKMLMLVNKDNRVRSNLAYHVAHTGRWGGRGIQPHNLPRFSHEDPEEVLRIFNECAYKVVKYHYPEMHKTASGLVRPAIISAEEKKFVCGDYRSIENVVLHWLAGDKKTVQDFANGLDQYKVYSSDRLNKHYDKITKEERQQSKPDVLGLGFGAGWTALVGVAAGYGVSLSPREADLRVKFYRRKYREVVKLWRNIYNNALIAIRHKTYRQLDLLYTTINFSSDGTNLWIYLPSGRELFYREIKLDAVWYIKVRGKNIPMTSEISYMGVKSNQWLRIGTHPGMLTENIVQALARDCLAHGLLCVEQEGWPVVLSVHDEILCEVPDTDEWRVEDMCKIMCTKRDWNKTLPLFADGWQGYRYKKD